jgi:hypothetical protein
MARLARREITGRELALAILGACALAVAMHWPLVLNLGDTVPKDLGDPLPQAWQIAWGGHALANQPLELFQANQFWPEVDSLAFGDALLGYAPLGLVGEGPDDAIVRYDLAFLFAYALAFLGAYLLARELGLGPAAATVAGAAFAFAPFRLEQDGHMQVISSGGIPLALAFAVRGIRLRRPGWLFGAWLVAAWQLSMGFAVGLPFAYLLGLMALIAALAWLVRGRPPVDRRLLAAGIAGALVFVVVAGLIARPYFRVADEHPEAKRPPSTVEAFSGPLSVFITAPEESFVWGEATAEIREDLENVPEKTLLPGALILLLALAGLGSSAFPRWLRVSLGLGALFVSVLALGFQEDDGWLWPYRVVYDLLPGWEAIRTPGRLVTFSALALALLAAAGTQSLTEAIRHWLAGRRFDVGPRGAVMLPGAIAALLAFAIVVEGRGLPFDPFGDQDQPELDATPPSVADVPAPQLHLPADTPEDNRRYLLWSTDEFPDIVNGRASTRPDEIEELIAAMGGFPDRETVERLRDYGVRSVVVHTDRIPNGEPSAAYPARASALGLSVDRRGELLVYGLRSRAGSGGAGD